jgi:hypothetical protein
MTRRVFRTPVGLVWLALSLIAWPVLAVFTPAGLLGHGDEPEGRLLQLSYLSQLTGALVSMVALEEGRWMLERCGPLRRVFLRWIAILTTSLIGSVCVLGVAGARGQVTDWMHILPMILVSGMHLSALAGWILDVPGSQRIRLLLLPFLSWLLPAVIQSSAWPVRWVIELLRSHPQAFDHRDPSLVELLAGIGPILVLASSHLLLVRWKQPYEVRHTR